MTTRLVRAAADHCPPTAIQPPRSCHLPAWREVDDDSASDRPVSPLREADSCGGPRCVSPESARFIAYLAPDRQVAKGASCDGRATGAFSAPPSCGGEIVSNERRGSVRSGFPGWRPLKGFRNGHDSAISRSGRDFLEAPPLRGGGTSRSNARCGVHLRQSRPRPAGAGLPVGSVPPRPRCQPSSPPTAITPASTEKSVMQRQSAVDRQPAPSPDVGWPRSRSDRAGIG
jgi:hypothetical protein